MKRKGLLMLVACLSLFSSLQGQQKYTVLDWKANTTWYHFLSERMHEQYRVRDSMLYAAISHKTLAAGYQQRMQHSYRGILGAFPAKTPLHAATAGTLNCKGYRIEKIYYQSFPGHHVTANLYVPDGDGPFPGLLLFCGHEATAKATTTYQQTAIRLALNGFVVLSIDPISQGERYQLTGPDGKPLTRGGTTAHTLLAAGSNLVGTSVVAYQILDNERGLDYLCSRPEVDTAHLGCLGNSGGGTQTAYFLPFDARIKAAAVCSYVTRRERTLELLGPQDGCQWLPGEGEAGIDISDYMAMVAPKPVIILAGRYGFVDFNGTLDVYRELKDVYASAGSPGNISLYASDNGHGIQTQKQLAAVRWFRRWLYGDSRMRDSSIPETQPASALQVTRSGQVNADFPNEKNIQDENLALADQWTDTRRQLRDTLSTREYRSLIRRVIQYEAGAGRVDTQHMGSFRQAGYYFEKLILRRRGMPPLPCLYGSVQPGRPARKFQLLLSGGGKAEAMADKTTLARSRNLGYDILVADLRGLGETQDDPEENDAKYWNKNYRTDMLALFTGASVATQRAEDIRTLTLLASTLAGGRPDSIMIQASGAAAEPALLAACLDSRITKVSLHHAVRSFYELLRNPLMKDQYAYVIPGVLKFFDLTDLADFAGSKRVRYEGN